MSVDLVPFQRPTADVEFLQVFNRLCVALREPQDDSGTTQTIYFEALRDLPTTALRGGADALMRESGRRFFPTTAEWRTAAQQAHETQLRQVVKRARDQPWREECTDCADTGWCFMNCRGGESCDCGRRREHGPHLYVIACACRPTNRTYLRTQNFGAGE